LRAVLLAAHGEIFDVRWWLELQQGLQRGVHHDVAPYPSASCLTPAALGLASVS